MAESSRQVLTLKKGKRQEKASLKPTHDVILGSLKKTNKVIVIKTLTGIEHKGVLSQFDRYTITLTLSDTNSSKLTIFKHAIESFSGEE